MLLKSLPIYKFIELEKLCIIFMYFFFITDSCKSLNLESVLVSLHVYEYKKLTFPSLHYTHLNKRLFCSLYGLPCLCMKALHYMIQNSDICFEKASE